MPQNLVLSIGLGLVNVLVALLFAPFCEGVIRKVTARIQSRQGPPIRQPYYDLLKLLGKEDLESGENPKVQRAAAYLAKLGCAGLFCAAGWHGSPFHNPGAPGFGLHPSRGRSQPLCGERHNFGSRPFQ